MKFCRVLESESESRLRSPEFEIFAGVGVRSRFFYPTPDFKRNFKKNLTTSRICFIRKLASCQCHIGKYTGHRKYRRKSLTRKKRKRVGARRPETSRSSSPLLSDCTNLYGEINIFCQITLFYKIHP